MLKQLVNILLSLAALAAIAVDAGPPIPPRPDGFSFGSMNAKVHIEAFYDLMCPNCQSSWPEVKKMLDHYKSPASDVRFTVHLFPLPYHRYSFLVAQIATAVASKDSSYVWMWMDAIFASQENFGNGPTEKLTTVAVTDSLCELAAEATGLSKEVVKKAVNSASDMSTRTSWKYGCYRSIFGTPTYLINGVPAPDEAGGWSSSKWIDFVESMLHGNLIPNLQFIS